MPARATSDALVQAKNSEPRKQPSQWYQENGEDGNKGREQVNLQPSESLQLFVDEKSQGWNPRILAKLLEERASVGSGKIELYIRQEKRLLRVSLAQSYLLDDSLESELKLLDGIDRVERRQAT